MSLENQAVRANLCIIIIFIESYELQARSELSRNLFRLGPIWAHRALMGP